MKQTGTQVADVGSQSTAGRLTDYLQATKNFHNLLQFANKHVILSAQSGMSSGTVPDKLIFRERKQTKKNRFGDDSFLHDNRTTG